MPTHKPQHLKSLLTINAQPQHMTPRMVTIIYMELGGMNNKQISEEIGLSADRVSVIKNCPMYKQQRTVVQGKLEKEVLDKQSTKIVAGDPVDIMMKDACVEAARKKIELMGRAESEFVQNAAASDILGIGGYQKKTSKTTTVIEVDQKLGERFERILRDGHQSDERKHKIRIKTEMSE